MSFFKSLFSAPEVIGKTTDAVIATGDALVFTDEEKSVANQKILDWMLKFHEASKGSNIARRFISIMFTLVFLTLVIACAILVGFGLSETADRLLELIVETLGTPMAMIIGFYFFSGYVRDFSQKDK